MPGGRIKVVGIPGRGEMPKFAGKIRRFQEGSIKKKKKNGGHGRFDRKSRGSTSKKSMSLSLVIFIQTGC